VLKGTIINIQLGGLWAVDYGLWTMDCSHALFVGTHWGSVCQLLTMCMPSIIYKINVFIYFLVYLIVVYNTHSEIIYIGI
jgi:hypothetical protein